MALKLNKVRKKVTNVGSIEPKTDDSIVIKADETMDERVLEAGQFSLKDFIAPSAIDRSDPTKIVIGNKHIRNYNVQGFPLQVGVGWLDELYSNEGDVDVAIHIAPTEDSKAIDELTRKITQFEAQLMIEEEKGENKNVTRYANMITGLMRQRQKLELNTEGLFQVGISTNISSTSAGELEKQAQKLENKLKARKIKIIPSYFRQDEGFKTCSPYGTAYMDDAFRNFNSGGLTACFPFYNSDISHPGGILCARNLSTGNNIFIDFYNRDLLNNGNITSIGKSGSGKTYANSLIILRSALRGIRTVIIDPEGEYSQITRVLGGKTIELSANSPQRINPFDLEEEDVLNDRGEVIGKMVNIKDKVSEVLALIAIMCKGMEQEEESITSTLLQALYSKFGFTEEVESLYSSESLYDEKTGKFHHNGIKKKMPTLSDFNDILQKYIEKTGKKELDKLSNSLQMFLKGGIYDMFDGQTTDDLKNLKSSIVINFDISKIEENITRPIAMHVALSWTWLKYCKKNQHLKKRVLADEAWMLTDSNMPGYEYTGKFLETLARRIRKRNGGLMVSSQGFKEFANSKYGEAVLKNSTVNIFFKQDDTDISAVQNTFNLSDGERNFLLQSRRGEALFKLPGESVIGRFEASEYEDFLIREHIIMANKRGMEGK